MSVVGFCELNLESASITTAARAFNLSNFILITFYNNNNGGDYNRNEVYTYFSHTSGITRVEAIKDVKAKRMPMN